MAKTLKITAGGHIRVVEVDFGCLENLQREVGGLLESVYTQRLQSYFGLNVLMVVDEEGIIKGLPMNPVGSLFYGTATHGNPIVGDVLLAVANGEEWRAPDEDQIEEWQARLKKDFWLKE